MFASRFFIGLLIPIILIGLLIWFASSLNVNSSDVRVAGAMVSAARVDVSVADSYITEEGRSRKLVVEIDARNVGGANVDISPHDFRLVLAGNENLAWATAPKGVFPPMSYTSTCEAAPGSTELIPPGATRHYSISFWGGSLPRGGEWGDYYLNLEYYDPALPLMLSKPLNPQGK